MLSSSDTPAVLSPLGTPMSGHACCACEAQCGVHYVVQVRLSCVNGANYHCNNVIPHTKLWQLWLLLYLLYAGKAGVLGILKVHTKTASE